MSDNVPTLRLPTSPPPAPPAAPPTPSGRPSKGPLIAFIVLSLLVVAAIGVLVWVLMGREPGGPRAVDSPSASNSSAPPVASSQPPRPSGVFTVFTVPQRQDCRDHGKDQHEVDAQVTWATAEATEVWIARGSTDAVSADGEQIPLAGSQDSFPVPIPIDCNTTSEAFTMTLVGMDGRHVSRTWTVMIARHRR